MFKFLHLNKSCSCICLPDICDYKIDPLVPISTLKSLVLLTLCVISIIFCMILQL